MVQKGQVHCNRDAESICSLVFGNYLEVKPAEISDRCSRAWCFDNHIFNHIPTGKKCF